MKKILQNPRFFLKKDLTLWGVCGIIYIVVKGKPHNIFERLVNRMEKEKVRIAVKRPNEDYEIVEVDKGFRSDILKKFIPSLSDYDRCDFVRCSKDGLFTVGVDEEGLLKELETNFYIETSNFPAERLVGVAVFTRVAYVNPCVEEIYDFTLVDLTDDDIRHIEETLNKEYQEKISKTYSEGNFPKVMFVKF